MAEAHSGDTSLGEEVQIERFPRDPHRPPFRRMGSARDPVHADIERSNSCWRSHLQPLRDLGPQQRIDGQANQKALQEALSSIVSWLSAVGSGRLIASHPDKIKLSENQTMEDAEAKYVELTKAYKSLTDEVTRENLAKYGNPDGPQQREDKIAIPTWVVEGRNNIWVLGLYGLVLGGGIPFVVVSCPNRLLLPADAARDDGGSLNEALPETVSSTPPPSFSSTTFAKTPTISRSSACWLHHSSSCRCWPARSEQARRSAKTNKEESMSWTRHSIPNVKRSKSMMTPKCATRASTSCRVRRPSARKRCFGHTCFDTTSRIYLCERVSV